MISSRNFFVCALALWIGVLGHAARAQTVTANPQNAGDGSTQITWDAGGGVKGLGATLWRQVNGGEETKVSSKAKGSKNFEIGAGETHVFKLYDFAKTRVLALTTVKADGENAKPDAANADGDDDKDDKKVGNASTGSFDGTWDTLADGAQEVTVILTQKGNKVTGTYSPNNGKIFDGVVVGNKLSFKWSQDAGREGTGEFTLNPDGKGFTGIATARKPELLSVTWNSYVPDPISFTGTYDTFSRNTAFVMTLQQTGVAVTGTYTPGNGAITGTVKDNLLRFQWTSDGGKGSGRFVMDKGELIFSGSYSNGDNPDKSDGLWIGTRKMSGGGGKAPSSFAGRWKALVAWTDKTYTMMLQLAQAGDKVSGTGNFLDVAVTVQEGVVEGKRLKLKLVSSTGKNKGNPAGDVEVLMNGDQKSFAGTTSITASLRLGMTGVYEGP